MSPTETASDGGVGRTRAGDGRPDALYILHADAFAQTYGADEQRRISEMVNVLAPPQTAATALHLPAAVLRRVQVLISGWGAPRLDADWLARCPHLEAVFHGAGSVSRVVTTDAWRRGIVVTSASAANAAAVAEYTLGVILVSLKGLWQFAPGRSAPTAASAAPLGCFQRTVGLVALGASGRAVAGHLRSFDLVTIAYDPHIRQGDVDALGIELVSLDDLFRQSDVVSIHAPELPETYHLVGERQLSMLKRGATFINTARSSVVDEAALVRVARHRPDLQFVLDVTDAPPGHPPLAELPNVMVTPHVAGSRGDECRRMGRTIVDELHRYVRGLPLRHQITIETALHSCHAPTA